MKVHLIIKFKGDYSEVIAVLANKRLVNKYMKLYKEELLKCGYKLISETWEVQRLRRGNYQQERKR